MAGQPISATERARQQALNNATTARGVPSQITPQNQQILGSINNQTTAKGAPQLINTPVNLDIAPTRLGQTVQRQGVEGPGQAQAAPKPRIENPMIVEQLASYNNAQAVKGQTQGLANSLLGAAAANPYTATNVASTSGGGPAPAAAAPRSASMVNGTAGGTSNLASRIQGANAAPTAASLGYNTAGLQNPGAAAFQLSPQQTQGGGFQIGAGGAPVAGQLGARPTVGAAPGNVAGQLGAGYTPQNVGSIAGQLGAAPQAGNVGNIAGSLGGYLSNTAGQLGAAPGAVAGQLGAGPGSFQMGAGPGGITGQRSGFGQTNAAQGEMLSRLSQFLDAPEGPSIAEAQLQQSQADNMASLIGAARSGRGGAGATAEAMRGALSEGGAVMADTAGQMATLRAQEEDMRKNRQLSGIGLGGQMSEAQRAGDLTFGAQELAALQGDQATALGTRGQDLQGNIANQLNALNVRGQNLSALQGDQSTALGARGQNLSALQGDQGASIAARGQNLGALQSDQGTQLGLQQLQGQLSLGARGQDLSALTADQSTALGLEGLRTNASLGLRGQDLSALQGDQATQLGYQGLAAQTALAGRGQDLSALQGDQGAALTGRGQDLTALMSDADRGLSAQQLNLQRELGLTGAGLTAQGQGLQYALGAEGQANTLAQSRAANETNRLINQAQINAQPSWLEQAGMQLIGGGASGGGAALMTAALASDETAKTDIGESVQALERHLEVTPGKTYRYKPGVRDEDPSVKHAGPMAQDLAKSPFGKSLVNRGPDGLLQVNTGRLALVDHAALAHLKSELDSLKRFLGDKVA